MIAWYSRARSSFSSSTIRSRVTFNSAFVSSLVIMYFQFRPRSGFHGEADLDGHLPVLHFPLVDVPARFDYLEPAQVLDGLVGALNGPPDRVLDGSGGGAGQLDKLIDGIFHLDRKSTRLNSSHA